MATRKKILQLTKVLVQKNGANGFSYQDIADKLKIKKASIHYYFPKKNDLLLEVVRYYKEQLKSFLKEIDAQNKSLNTKFKSYLSMYLGLADDSTQICLCGILAGEIMTLPKVFKKEIKEFFDIHEEWLDQLFLEMKNPRLFAKEVLAALQGALIIGRVNSDPLYIKEVTEKLWKS
jgi:TetR/AcrR family transcriptional repressor of nem operon